MVADPSVGANFLLLLIAKRNFFGNFEASATLFTADAPPRYIALENEPLLPAEADGPLKRLARRILSL
jgi:hypothetical protein